MAALPNYRPRQLSLGPLEEEIFTLVWTLGSATVKAIHEQILAQPNRELTYSSVTTVLNRLTQKGWLSCDKSDRSFTWQARLSPEQARSLRAHQQLQSFLAVGNADVVATFADSLDQASVDQIDAIAKKIKAARQAREN
ncbi:MAG: BlaI/MecI/CopY family transcriptional regulator [Thermosynechococcaceae cyanobacterium]